MDDIRHLLTHEELATRLGVGVGDLRIAAADGVFPAPVRLAADGPLLFRWLEVLAWLEGPGAPDWHRIRAKADHFDRCLIRAIELGIEFQHPYLEG